MVSSWIVSRVSGAETGAKKKWPFPGPSRLVGWEAQRSQPTTRGAARLRGTFSRTQDQRRDERDAEVPALNQLSSQGDANTTPRIAGVGKLTLKPGDGPLNLLPAVGVRRACKQDRNEAATERCRTDSNPLHIHDVPSHFCSHRRHRRLRRWCGGRVVGNIVHLTSSQIVFASQRFVAESRNGGWARRRPTSRVSDRIAHNEES